MNLLGSRRVFSKKCRLVKFSMVALVSATMAVTTVTLENTALARQTQVSNDVVLNDGGWRKQVPKRSISLDIQ